MAFDEELADRVRELIGPEPGLAEKRMFGGLAMLLNGNMAVGVRGQGGLLVRVDPDESDDLLVEPGADLMEMRGRRLRGWLTVAPSACRSDADLGRWVGRGVAYARSLPAK
ncbi:TfoX/Sxy family protein [Phytohabitans rumicis]|uniref:TfoX/Sxy family protein n=1 Tax=Phytohabitans rumicis TaxID=1076125 RepID=UPI0031E93FD2